MLPDSSLLSSLLGCLYDAASDPRLWPGFLQKLSSAAPGTGAALILHNPKQGEHTIALHSGYDADALRLYGEYYGQRDIWMQRAFPSSYAGWVGMSEEVCPPSEFFRTEIYNDFLESVNVAHAIWATIDHPREGRTNNLGIYRGRKQGPFAKGDLDLLRFLLPHMKRAFHLHFQFAELRQKSDDLQIALDHVNSGIALLGEGGKVVAMNRAAATLLAQQDGLQLRNEMLRAENSRESEKLQAMLTRVQATSLCKGSSPGGTMMVTRKIRPPLSLLVTPVRSTALGSISENVRAIVFMQDPANRVRPPQEILTAAYGLTPAECRVALLLGDGKSLREIAQLLDVSANTLKSHLANIFRKTNTSRQSQLVRLLMRLPSSPE